MKIPAFLVRPRLLYGAFAVLALALSLRWTFPSEAVKERLIYEAGARGWQIDVEDVRPGALLGIRMDGVTLTDASGLKIPVERLSASLRAVPLLVGRRVVDFRASIYDGTVEGSAGLSGPSRPLTLAVDGVDLARALPLRKAAGVGFSGKVTGRVDLALPGGALDKASGTAELSIAQAGLAGGQVPIPPLAGGVNLPPISVGALSASAKVETGRISVEKLETRGGDVELSGDGIALVLQPRMEYAPVVGQARLRFQPSLWQKPEAAKLRPIVEAGLASSRAPDGSYRLQLTGSLGHPQVRPVGPGSGPPPALPPPTRAPPSAPARPAPPAGEPD